MTEISVTPSPQDEGQTKAPVRINIPRPPNSFMIFRRDYARSLAETNVVSKILQSNVSQMAGAIWRSMSKEDKMPYEVRANAEKIEHMKNYPDYVYRPKRKGRRYQGTGEERLEVKPKEAVQKPKRQSHPRIQADGTHPPTPTSPHRDSESSNYSDSLAEGSSYELATYTHFDIHSSSTPAEQQQQQRMPVAESSLFQAVVPAAYNGSTRFSRVIHKQEVSRNSPHPSTHNSLGVHGTPASPGQQLTFIYEPFCQAVRESQQNYIPASRPIQQLYPTGATESALSTGYNEGWQPNAPFFSLTPTDYHTFSNGSQSIVAPQASQAIPQHFIPYAGVNSLSGRSAPVATSFDKVHGLDVLSQQLRALIDDRQENLSLERSGRVSTTDAFNTYQGREQVNAGFAAQRSATRDELYANYQSHIRQGIDASYIGSFKNVWSHTSSGYTNISEQGLNTGGVPMYQQYQHKGQLYLGLEPTPSEALSSAENQQLYHISQCSSPAVSSTSSYYLSHLDELFNEIWSPKL